MREQFLSAVYMVIVNDNNEILFQERKNTKLWSGFYGLPAGHVDNNENVYQALFREAKEELDIDIDMSSIKDIFVVNRINSTLMNYFDIYFVIDRYLGQIKNNEPFKCNNLKWIKADLIKNINTLDDVVIPFEIEALKNYKYGIKFSTINVDDNEKIEDFIRKKRR